MQALQGIEQHFVEGFPAFSGASSNVTL